MAKDREPVSMPNTDLRLVRGGPSRGSVAGGPSASPTAWSGAQVAHHLSHADASPSADSRALELTAASISNTYLTGLNHLWYIRRALLWLAQGFRARSHGRRGGGGGRRKRSMTKTQPLSDLDIERLCGGGGNHVFLVVEGAAWDFFSPSGYLYSAHSGLFMRYGRGATRRGLNAAARRLTQAMGVKRYGNLPVV
ncbi:hypothetical protein L249_2189 [Ophiocordyceps polyrhachis-furcata BCC 54312]|uniref:Uncharacterized protein n=1 Tax=Ophiocordyceps polyrhachis-furcata BCC 54312 TaxID=1330021 RepID=A0A367LRA0_9HYPO|nr:hypothetical protein L249_2189 [Ophiocordyceps polyrhachis-furcata BCC 54312]